MEFKHHRRETDFDHRVGEDVVTDPQLLDSTATDEQSAGCGAVFGSAEMLGVGNARRKVNPPNKHRASAPGLWFWSLKRVTRIVFHDTLYLSPSCVATFRSTSPMLDVFGQSLVKSRGDPP